MYHVTCEYSGVFCGYLNADELTWFAYAVIAPLRLCLPFRLGEAPK
jgi:hypothetical protein